MIYPYSSPFILNDATFFAYIGTITSSGTAFQRQVAYWLAESKVSEDLDTLLQPTNVTGVFDPAWKVQLDYGYINSINSVRFLDGLGAAIFTASGPVSDYFALDDAGYGTLDIAYLSGLCNCSPDYGAYKIEVAYNVGLPTGTSTMPDFLLALSTYARIELNEMIGYGNEGPGDVGIESFNAQQYAERRRIQNTTFGSSPEAMFVHRLLSRYRKYRYVGL